MNFGIKLGAIPPGAYAEYKYEVIFKAYKWDPQVGDSNTVSKHAVLMQRGEAERLSRWTERLSTETMAMEEELATRPELAKELGIPGNILKKLEKMTGYSRNENVRLMRFDFHPAAEGWALSEVNSDVPGGLAEASALPALASAYFDGYGPYGDTAGALITAFRSKIKAGGTIGFIHATSYSDDRQVMQFLGDRFEEAGYRAVYLAPDNITWAGRKMAGLDGAFRFYPLEWLANLPRRSAWANLFECETPVCNHPVAIYTQSKRLPLIWDKLWAKKPIWKKLLPRTVAPNLANGGWSSLGGPGGRDGRYGIGASRSGTWVIKPALGRVGEGIAICGVTAEETGMAIEKAVIKNPGDWFIQKKFNSLPLYDENGAAKHLCVGAFSVDGRFAGFYGRLNDYAHIDASAKDIPVIVATGTNDGAAKLMAAYSSA